MAEVSRFQGGREIFSLVGVRVSGIPVPCRYCLKGFLRGGMFGLRKIRKFLRELIYQVSIFLGMIVVGAASVIIYHQSQKIGEKLAMGSGGGEPVRLPAAEPVHDDEAFPITDVIIPAYAEASPFRKIVVDFFVVPSSPGIRNYFWIDHNTHLIYDRLNSTLAPMLLEFPLREEGKNVLKEKIRREINQLAKELGLDGEIEKVYIGRIFAA